MCDKLGKTLDKELAELAADLEAFEGERQRRRESRQRSGEPAEEEDEEDNQEDDDPGDEVDPLEALTEDERKQFEIDIRPMKLAVAKVSTMPRTDAQHGFSTYHCKNRYETSASKSSTLARVFCPLGKRRARRRVSP